MMTLEQDSLWLRINNKIKGPLFIISILYIVSFIVLTLALTLLKIEMTGMQMALYYIGFALLIISVWIAFIGWLLRGIDKSRNHKQ